MKRQHANDVRILREQLTAERDQWQTEVVAKLTREFAAKEEQVRVQLVRERDEQLEALMERLGEEQLGEVQRATAAAREREAVEVARAEAAERACDALRQNLSAAEGAAATQVQVEARLQARILDLEAGKAEERKTKEEAESNMSAVISELTRVKELHKAEVENVWRQAEQDTLTARGEIQRLTDLLAGAQDATREQAAQAQQRETEIIAEVEARVRRALHKKDETMQALQMELQAKDMKIQGYVDLLQRQREELLGDI